MTQNTDATDTTYTIQVDARGLKCPMPVIKLQQAIRQLQNGTELAQPHQGSDPAHNGWLIEITCTDAGAPKDLESWCGVNRHTFLGCEAHDEGHICRIRVTRS